MMIGLLILFLYCVIFFFFTDHCHATMFCHHISHGSVPINTDSTDSFALTIYAVVSLESIGAPLTATILILTPLPLFLIFHSLIDNPALCGPLLV